MNRQSAEVLVIEDDRDIRELLRLMLEGAGYTVYEAPDGMSGLNRLRTHPTPLVVLLDWQMPGMDGLQVLQALAADAPVAQRHSFTLLTALYDAPELYSDPFPPDVSVSILGKPCDMNSLLQAVTQAEERLALAGERQ